MQFLNPVRVKRTGNIGTIVDWDTLKQRHKCFQKSEVDYLVQIEDGSFWWLNEEDVEWIPHHIVKAIIRPLT